VIHVAWVCPWARLSGVDARRREVAGSRIMKSAISRILGWSIMDVAFASCGLRM
jgi:hypothetical protein